VKPGWKSGTKVTFPPTATFPKYCEVIIQLKQSPNELVRVKNDLYFTYKLKRSLGKKDLTIQLPNAQTLRLDLEKEGLYPKGGEKRFRGLGMPISNSKLTLNSEKIISYGDLILSVQPI
jgi:hypothetical protein